MLDQELIQKMIHDQPLTADEEARLDTMLAETEPVGKLVSAIEEDVPSMAWRSALNDRLIELQPKVRTRRAFAWWKLAAPAGIAAAFAIWSMTRPAVGPDTVGASGTPSLEATLVRAHQDVSTQLDLGGHAMTVSTAPSGGSSESETEINEWNPSDLESL